MNITTLRLPCAISRFHNKIDFGEYNREIKGHVYGKRQTSDSSWEILKIEIKQIKTIQNNSYG